MTLTTAQQVRLRIQDPYRYEEVVRYGDGTANRFLLTRANLTNGSAFVPSAATAGWSGTGAAWNASGYIDFSGVISANSAFRLTYQWSIFSDDEVGHFTAVGGTIAGAALEAVRTLQFDALRRARWMSPDGAQYDDTMAQIHLHRMESALRHEVEQQGIGQGAIYGWAETQQDY